MIRNLVMGQRSRLLAIRQYLVSQGITVACNLVYGLLCVRLLAASDYAKFVVLFGVQGTFVILMDVGVSGSLIPLIGERVNDHKLIADYLATLRGVGQRLYFGLALCLIVAYPILVRHRQWDVPTVAAMVGILLISTWFMRIGASYGAVLILMQKRSLWYRGQMISAAGTLIILLAVKAIGWLGALEAILINVAGIVFIAAFYFVQTRKLLGHRGVVSKDKRKAIVKLALPNIPGIVFYALQGQIALMLITLFGRTTSVASVGALSRLGQIFVIFGQMNMLLIEPFFARLPMQRLWKNYMAVLAITSALCLLVVAAACVFPRVFLFVLGPTYSGLTTEVKIVVASSSVSYLTNVLWSMHSARRFIYWWSNIANIFLTVVVQVLFIVKADLARVRSVVWLSFATVLVAFLTNALSGAYGYLNGPRSTDVSHLADADPSGVDAIGLTRTSA
jgi:O-antigen/teichoic acid export membrane protein